MDENYCEIQLDNVVKLLITLKQDVLDRMVSKKRIVITQGGKTNGSNCNIF